MLNECCSIILAGGIGKRMKSSKPKVMSEVLFKPMISWVIDACKNSNIKNISVVTGALHEQLENFLNKVYPSELSFSFQSEQKGTGHAAMQAKDFLNKFKDKHVLILCGDSPFLDSDTIKFSYKHHIKNSFSATIITSTLDDPSGYGRIIRRNDEVISIVEDKDCTDVQVKIKEVNSGAYWFNVSYLLDMIEMISCNNSQNEYYLTDIIEIFIKNNLNVGAYIVNNDVIIGANTRKDLLRMNEKARIAVIDKLLDKGVEFSCIEGVVISPDAVIEQGTIIHASTVIKGKVFIGQNCSIGPNTFIDSCSIGSGVTVNASQCYSSTIHDNIYIGPFSHIRPNCVINSNVKIGDFVEIKNSNIGESTSVAHLTYIGDSDIGKNVNMGCGTVTVNYDGINKYRTIVGDGAFIGCNTNLIAPVKVGSYAYTAAGSTITNDVPTGALGVARNRQENKVGFANKKLKNKN